VFTLKTEDARDQSEVDGGGDDEKQLRRVNLAQRGGP